MPQFLGNLTPITSSFTPLTPFLRPLSFLSSPTTSPVPATTTNRWILLIIGGTAIAVIAFGGSASIQVDYPYSESGSSSRSRQGVRSSSNRKSRLTTELPPNIHSGSTVKKDMFWLASYLVGKIGSFIPWRSAASVLENITGRQRQGVEGVVLGVRGGDGDRASWNETERLRRLLDEALAKEVEDAKALEEVEALRTEVQLLKTELERTRGEKGKGKGGEKMGGENGVVELIDPYSVAQDNISEDEVISLLEILNTEMVDTAGIIARAFANSRKPSPPLPSEEISEDLVEAIASATEILGHGMVNWLQEPQRRGARVGEDGVKIALVASMAAYTHWIISSWYFENPEDEHLLSEIYARVRETEEQMVSGRWRALTRVHLQRMLATEPDLTIYMVDAFVNIILTAGWHNDAAALQDYLIQTFGQKIGGVLGKAKWLNKVIGEEIIRCDLEALYIAPDAIFNEATMEAGDLMGPLLDEPREGRVLCTAELGLVKAEKRVGKAGEWEEAVLLRPRVILQSSVAGGA